MTRLGKISSVAAALALSACGGAQVAAQSVGNWIVQPLRIDYRGVDGQLASQIIEYDVLCAPREVTAIKDSPLEGGEWVKSGGNPVNATPFPKFAAFEVTDGLLVVEPICIGENVNQPHRISRPQFIQTPIEQKLATRLYLVSGNQAELVLPLSDAPETQDAQKIYQTLKMAPPADWQIEYGETRQLEKSEYRSYLQAAEKMRKTVDANIDLYAVLSAEYPSWTASGYKTTRHGRRDEIAKMALELRATD